jgi:hypothetical protein
MKESKNKKWLWVAVITLTKEEDNVNIYSYRTHSFYGTQNQVNQDYLPQIEQALMACGWAVHKEVLEREDSGSEALKFINGVTGKIIKV